jgi:FtsZ-binding cell division protein ZapB
LSNSVLPSVSYPVLVGGLWNTNGASYSVVPGGDQNFAGGTNSFAAGHRAKANYAGDFVWADSQDADFNSTVNNQFLIRAANGVGINKANPASALDVNGTVTATSFVGNGSGLTSLNAASLGTSSINNNQLVNNSVTVSAGTGLSGGGAVALGGSVTLNNSGVLSVGASGPLASSGGQNPQITLTGIVSIANGGLGFAPGVLSSGQYIRSSGSGSWSVNSIQAGDLPSLSATYVDLSSGQTIGGTKNFSGSVGIGISPGFPLDVNGRMALRGSSSGVNAGLWLYDSAATSHTARALLGMDGTGYFGLWGDMGANWGMVMNVTNGYVGIGTLTPDALLTVNGTADKPGGGSWSTFSDGRLKDVGAKFTHGLADLARIQPVHYHYKADNPLNLPSQPEYVGVVAQQVQPAIPEAVQPNKDGYLTVNNDPIIWTMVNAIKELNQNLADGSQNSEVRIQKLETENAELKAHNEALSARLERIEKLLGQQLK